MSQKFSHQLIDSLGNLVFLEKIDTVGQFTFRLRFFPDTPEQEIWFLGVREDLAKAKFRTLLRFADNCKGDKS